MNVFDAQISGGMVRIGEANIGPVRSPDRPIKLGLRPEHLVLDDNGPLEATIQMSEPLGANTLLHGRLPASNDIITISLAGVHAIGEKTARMRFAVDPANIHLFDPSTGERLTT